MSVERQNRGFTLVELPAVSRRGFTLVELLACQPKYGSQSEPGRRQARAAFTLVELLVVIGIIALLAAILLPAINSVLKKGEQTKAQAQVKALATAWKNYYNEYGKWPVTNNNCIGVNGLLAREGANGSYGIPMNSNLVMLLSPNLYDNKGFQSSTDEEKIKLYNPKRITFFEFDKEAIDHTYALVDPWGQTNMFLFDLNDDGVITSRLGVAVYDSVIAWSPGADGVATTLTDNAKSWE